MKYLKRFESLSEDDDLLEEVFDILQDCSDEGIEISYAEPSIFHMNQVSAEVVALRITLYAGLIELLGPDNIKKFKDIKPNIEHLISYMKSIGYNNFYYSDVETHFNTSNVRKGIKGELNILPEDNDNISHVYMTFIKNGVYNGKVFN